MQTRPDNPAALRLASYNIQAGIGSHRLRHVLTHGYRYVVPHRDAAINLEHIAGLLKDFDIVALQEADAGSFRTRNIHQPQYIAEHADFPYWHCQITREMGNIARMTLGVLSRIPWQNITQHRLPASKHGRAALEIGLDVWGQRLTVIITHLSLGKASRMRQVHFLSELISRQPAAILMGDLNCDPDSHEFASLLSHTRLQDFTARPLTFPSWKPVRALDHILATDDFALEKLRALPADYSDHLPVSAQLRLRSSDAPIAARIEDSTAKDVENEK